MKRILVVCLLACLAACGPAREATFTPEENRANALKPPVAKRVDHSYTLHGQVVQDPYQWLKDKSRQNPDVLAYIEAENSYADQVMAHTRELQQELFAEMKGRIKETDTTVPVRIDDYLYYWRNEQGKQYGIYCRRKGGMDSAEQVVLDLNRLAEGHDYFDLYALEVSPEHDLIAYTVDYNGAEQYTMYICAMADKVVTETIAPPVGDVCWANDNQTLFYTIEDDATRAYRLYRHTLGQENKHDALLFTEADERFFLGLYKSRSKRFILLHSESKTTSECHVIPADEPEAEPRVVEPRRPGVLYDVHHWHDFFFIRTNDQAKDFRIVKAPVDRPAKDNWQPFIPGRAMTTLNISVFDAFMVVSERSDAVKRVRVLDLDTMAGRYVSFPDDAYTFSMGYNPTFSTTVFRFTYESLIAPFSLMEYDVTSGAVTCLKQDEVLGGYDKSEYQTKRIFAQARDGARLPISLVYKKNLFRGNGSNPLYLAGYGAYGDAYDPYFSSNRLSLLERGFVYAIAHVRGGGEYGRTWYEQGKMLHKLHSFQDLIDCAQHLITEDYTRPDRLIAAGGSAGGLLVAAAMNMRPEVFHIVVADVPFVDVLNTLLDPSLPLTVTEYEEWGDPNDAAYFNYIRSYCPYQNVTAQDYPHILLTAGFYDPRVNFWEPAKLAAKLRAMKTDGNLLLLRTNMAGHGGASGRYDFLREIAFEYAFIINILSE